MKLTREQQEKTERMFQLHHAYYLLDGTKNLELPEYIVKKIHVAQTHIEHEQNKIRQDLIEENYARTKNS